MTRRLAAVTLNLIVLTGIAPFAQATSGPPDMVRLLNQLPVRPESNAG